MSRTRYPYQNIRKLNAVFQNMKKRCYVVGDRDYGNYGGRGIRICRKWLIDRGSFYRWANTSGYSVSLRIDRINNDTGYSPANCRWITSAEQARNRRTSVMITWKGRTDTIAGWARGFGRHCSAFKNRLKRGWDIHSAMTRAFEVKR